MTPSVPDLVSHTGYARHTGHAMESSQHAEVHCGPLKAFGQGDHNDILVISEMVTLWSFQNDSVILRLVTLINDFLVIFFNDPVVRRPISLDNNRLCISE